MTIEEILAALQAAASDPNATAETLQLAITSASDALTQLLADASKSATVTDEQIQEAQKALKNLVSKKSDLISQKEKAANRQGLQELANALKTVGTPSLVIPQNTQTQVRTTRKSKMFKDGNEALAVGAYILLQSKDLSPRHKNQLEEIVNKAIMTEGNAQSGGLFVQQTLDSTVLRQASDWGIFERYAKTVTGTSNSHRFNKATSRGATFTSISELDTFSQSNPTYDSLTLTAKKFVAETQMSWELDQDAIINFADEIANEFSLGIAQMIDKCGFIGDGTSTYGDIVGANQRWKQIIEDAGGTITNDTHKGYLASWHTTASATAIAKADLDLAVRKVLGNSKVLFMNELFFGKYIEPLYNGVGSAYALSPADVENGVNAKWGGYPIVFTEVLPSTLAVDTCPIVIGDLGVGAFLFKRNELEVKQLAQSSADAADDVYTWQAHARFDVAVWDAGNYHATEVSRVRGSVGGLIIKHS